MSKNIIQALTEVMTAVGAVTKGERNTQQGFNFRGIDSVVNAVSPALRAAGVVVSPNVLHSEYGTVEVGQKRTPMGHARLTVAYTFTAADGSSVTSTVCSESMDSGDKATAKAMSVAFRTALLQTLCLPTDEVDPDAESYERAPATAPKPKPSTGTRQHPDAAAALTKSQQILAERQAVKKGFPDLLAAATAILGRPLASLDDLTNIDTATLLPALFNTEDQP